MISREGTMILAALAAVVGLASPGHAAPLTEEAMTFIDGRLFRAKLMSNPKAALEYCRAAEAKAAEHDRDPYFDGAIAECLATAHAHLKEKDAACLHLKRALVSLEAVPAGHPRRAEAAELISDIRRDQSWFGC
jgi:hypothetical protein